MESGGARLPCLPRNTGSLLSSEASFVSGMGSLTPRGQPWSWGWDGVGDGGWRPGRKKWDIFSMGGNDACKAKEALVSLRPQCPPASPWLAGNIQSQ